MFKHSKKFGRLMTMLMVVVMLVSVLSLGAFAETGVFSGGTVTITKTLTKNQNAYAPNTSFSFAVAAAGAGTYNGKVVYEGVGTPTVGAPIAFTPSGADIGKTTVTGTTTITFAENTFSKPGIYHYTVTETAGSYDGITYDDTVKNLYVYVVNGEDGALKIDGVVMTDSSGKSDGFTNEYTTNDLTITKTVEGNQGDENKDFNFTVEVDGATGEQYKLVVNGTATVLTSGTAVDITLKHDQSATIYGLSANDTYTVTEEDYTIDGYTTTVNGTSGHEATGKITANTTVAFVNSKDAGSPTGVLMNIAPYAIMIVLAGVCAVLFLRKKNHEA